MQDIPGFHNIAQISKAGSTSKLQDKALQKPWPTLRNAVIASGANENAIEAVAAIYTLQALATAVVDLADLICEGQPRHPTFDNLFRRPVFIRDITGLSSIAQSGNESKQKSLQKAWPALVKAVKARGAEENAIEAVAATYTLQAVASAVVALAATDADLSPSNLTSGLKHPIPTARLLVDAAYSASHFADAEVILAQDFWHAIETARAVKRSQREAARHNPATDASRRQAAIASHVESYLAIDADDTPEHRRLQTLINTVLKDKRPCFYCNSTMTGDLHQYVPEDFTGGRDPSRIGLIENDKGEDVLACGGCRSA